MTLADTWTSWRTRWTWPGTRHAAWLLSWLPTSWPQTWNWCPVPDWSPASSTCSTRPNQSLHHLHFPPQTGPLISPVIDLRCAENKKHLFLFFSFFHSFKIFNFFCSFVFVSILIATITQGLKIVESLVWWQNIRISKTLPVEKCRKSETIRISYGWLVEANKLKFGTQVYIVTSFRPFTVKKLSNH